LPSKKSPNIRVLLADDSESFLRVAQLLLRDYDVDVARDGEEALRKIRANPPDVLFVDLVLPKISGTDLIPQVKAINPRIAIVALTAIDDDETVREVLRLGASDYLIKGALSSETLRSTIEKVIHAVSKQLKNS